MMIENESPKREARMAMALAAAMGLTPPPSERPRGWGPMKTPAQRKAENEARKRKKAERQRRKAGRR